MGDAAADVDDAEMRLMRDAVADAEEGCCVEDDGCCAVEEDEDSVEEEVMMPAAAECMGKLS